MQRRVIAKDSKKARVSDLGLLRGAGDENRTRALSLGSCERLRLIEALNWANARGVASLGCVALPVVPPCFPPDLVRLWCRANGSSSSRVLLDLP